MCMIGYFKHTRDLLKKRPTLKEILRFIPICIGCIFAGILFMAEGKIGKKNDNNL